MNKKLILLILCLSVCVFGACKKDESNTIVRGIDFGMSMDKVTSIESKKNGIDSIYSEDSKLLYDKVNAFGVSDSALMYVFEDDKLSVIFFSCPASKDNLEILLNNLRDDYGKESDYDDDRGIGNYSWNNNKHTIELTYNLLESDIIDPEDHSLSITIKSN